MCVKISSFLVIFLAVSHTSAHNSTDTSVGDPRILLTPLISRLTFPWVPTLLIPPSSTQRIQLIWGVGIPLQREVESLIWGMTIKAAYWITTSLNDLKPKPLAGLVKGERRRRGIETPGSRLQMPVENPKGDRDEQERFSRWHMYAVIEFYAKGFKLGGRECVLRAICEATEASLSSYSGVVGEMLHIILTPSSSPDPPSKNSDYEYFHAEKVGKQGEDCEQVFKGCSVSLLELFTGIHNPSMYDMEN